MKQEVIFLKNVFIVENFKYDQSKETRMVSLHLSDSDSSITLANWVLSISFQTIFKFFFSENLKANSSHYLIPSVSTLVCIVSRQILFILYVYVIPDNNSSKTQEILNIIQYSGQI